jgi:hypothetical protein
VAEVANAHDAAVISLGTMGPRPCDMAQRVRTRQAQAPHLVFVYDAGPWGDGRSRDLTHQGQVCWVVAPSRRPPQAGDRGHTDRRDAVPLARLLRSGPDAVGIFPWRAPPPGRPPEDWNYPCPSGPRRRGLGLARSGQRESAPATPPGTAPQADPRHELEGARAAVQTLSTPAGPRQTRQPGGRGHCPGADRVDVGPGPAGPCDRRDTAAVWSLHRASQRVCR